MKIINDNKVIFDGAFDSSKIDFADKETSVCEDFMLRYNDKNIMTGDMTMVLYDFMTEMEYFGVDDDLTKFYLFCGIYDEPCLSAWCKPCIFDYDVQNEHDKKMWRKAYDKSTDEEEKALIKKTIEEDKKLDKECADNQIDALEDLKRDGGYEITTFTLKLTDTEKQQLKIAMESMLNGELK